jgi:hypothetical protein
LAQLMIAVALVAVVMGHALGLGIVAINVVQGWKAHRRVERLGGNLLIRVVRPWLKRLDEIGPVLQAVSSWLGSPERTRNWFKRSSNGALAS